MIGKQFSLHSALITLLIILLISGTAPAQSETGVPFLLTHPSPHLNGMAGAFTALPTTDPHGQFFNPAQLGNFGREKNFSIQFFTPATKWLPNYSFSDLKFSSTACAIGYNLQNYHASLPLSIGIGIVKTNYDLGNNAWTNSRGEILGYFDSEEYYTAYSIGASLDYGVKFNIGYTFKKITSKISPLEVTVGNETGDAKAEGNAHDFGIQVVVPVISIIDKRNNKETLLWGKFKPKTDLSLGYSLLNTGDQIYYINPRLADPLPKSAQIGLAITLGLDMPIRETVFSVIKLDLSTEARDLLIERSTDSLGTGKYISSPGKINFWKNVLQGESTDQIAVYKGWRIQIGEFIELSYGEISGESRFDNGISTSGYRISSRGLLKFINMYTDNPVVSYMAEHIEVSYAYSSYKSTNDSHPYSRTKFKGITISIFGY
ncbi:MAG: hypothetical protein JXR46_08230 [Calditrichaceae bacterium]|nr:hypothetical protein [Calditrichaceae bacterium]MBN2709017.1 hypothetical protein [Calditrichaceae bacterium]RQV95331.1 MAG: hypothetical protein EH224_07905 [Calditrichota bacterium]